LQRRIIVMSIAAALAACGPTDPVGPEVSSNPAVSKTFHPPAPTTYSGRATAVDATVKVLFASITTRLGDTGPLPSDGGTLQASALTLTVPGVMSAGVAEDSTTGGNRDASSESSVANAAIAVGGVGITASLLSSQTDANCLGGPPSLSGSSTITDLEINGETVSISGAPNQTITLLGGLVRVVINEQTRTANSIDVSALHITVGGITDVVVARTHSDITCGG
jgi:hypothetical protein